MKLVRLHGKRLADAGLAATVAFGLIGTSAGTALAQAPAPPPSSVARAAAADPEVDRLVAEALANAPEIAAADAASSSARLAIAPARTLPDPSVSIGYQNDGRSPTLGERDMTFLGATFSQPIPWPGKLRLAGKEAALRADAAVAGAPARARLALEARVRRAYARLLLGRALLDLVEERARVSRDIVSLARDRYAVGEGVQQDLLRAQAEVVRLDEARASAQAEERNARAELARLLRRTDGAAVEIAGRLELHREVPDAEALVRASLAKSPELAAAASEVAAGQARAELAEKERLPDFVASAGPMYRGRLDPMWQVGIGVTLPIFSGSRQKPRRDAARADVEAAKARSASLALELELVTRQRVESLAAAIRIAGLYADGVLPLDQLSLEAALASYRAGKVPFVTVLEALTAVYSDRALYLARLSESDSLRASIDEADTSAPAGLSAGVSASSSTSAPAGSAMASAGSMR